MKSADDRSLHISLIIPTYNASKHIRELLDLLNKQTIERKEIIVIDSSSIDGTVNIAKSFGARVISIPRGEFDHGGTRTLAGKLAKGRILVYLTQDALPCDSYAIENIVRPFYEDAKIGAVFGRQVPYEDTNLFGKHLRYFNYPEISYIREYKDKVDYGIKTVFLSNSFAAYRRTVLEQIGWFKSGLILGEDTYAGAKILKLGYKVAYTSEARVYHSHSYTVWQEFKRYFDIGVFHRCENWILREFGKPEGEGFRYVLSEIRFLLNRKTYFLLPECILRVLMKWIGYNLGYNYDKIPACLVKRLTMNVLWWE